MYFINIVYTSASINIRTIESIFTIGRINRYLKKKINCWHFEYFFNI